MTLLIHGGAGRELISQREAALYAEGLMRALLAGANSKSARESVVLAISALEEDPLWNAGVGAVLAEDGLPYLDASFALSSGQSGAVAGLLRISSPIKAASLVARRSSYSLLIARAAEEWLFKQGLEPSPPEERITTYQQEMLQRSLSGEKLDSLCTVGAVALDKKGRLAAGTSTGGLRGKHPGRVGDSAIVGAGTWCSSECAISMTGDGDAMLARSSAARIALDIKNGKRAKKAIKKELKALKAIGADAGCIALLDSGKGFAMRNCEVLHSASFSKKGVFISK